MTLPPQLTLEAVTPPPREPAHALTALRAWDPRGLDGWVLAAAEGARLPLSADECRALAQSVDSLEFSAPEFERLIALCGHHLWARPRGRRALPRRAQRQPARRRGEVPA